MKIYKYTTSEVNLFDPSATDTAKGYVNNNFLNSDGALGSSNDWAVSEYIEIPAGATELTVNIDIGVNPSICLYDANKEFKIGEKYNSRTTFTIYTQNKYKYFRLSFYKPHASNFSVTSDALGWRETEGYQYKAGENLFDAATNNVTTGKFIDDQGLPVSSNTLSYTDYVPIEANKTYTRKWTGPALTTGGSVSVAWYNSSKVFIIRTPSQRYETGTTEMEDNFTAPANAAYVIINFPSATWPNADVNLEFYETEVKWREATAHEYSSGSWD